MSPTATARRLPPLVAAALLASAALAGCLPDTLSDAEVQERYEGAEVCGNGVQQDGEQCDDGNTDDGDGCAADCTLELSCGNGDDDEGEQCDDGNQALCDGCEACQRRRVLRIGPSRPWAFQEVGKEATALNPTFGDSFAVEAWFRTASVPASDGNDRSIFLMRASGLDSGDNGGSGGSNQGYALLGVGIRPEPGGVYKTSCLLLWQDQGPNAATIGADVSTGAKLPAGEWHHIRCVYDPRSGNQAGQLGVAVDGSAYAFTPLAGGGQLGWVQLRNRAIFRTNTSGGLFSSSFFAVSSFNDAESDLAPFDGVVDEVRWVTDPQTYTTGEGLEGKNVVQRRWPDGRAADALLLHMDEADGVTKLVDTSPTGLDLLSASPASGFSQTPLQLQPDACYGAAQAELVCAGEASDIFWCAAP